jgi:hypothetical protein
MVVGLLGTKQSHAAHPFQGGPELQTETLPLSSDI